MPNPEANTPGEINPQDANSGNAGSGAPVDDIHDPNRSHLDGPGLSDAYSETPGQSLGNTINPLENPQSLPSVVVGVDESPDVKEPSLPMIGFHLSKFVLYIISGFIILLLVFLFIKQFDASPQIKIPEQVNISDSSYAHKIEIIKIIQEEKKNYRDFTLQISQMILLNLLLPVLTAILGYIFASNKNKD